MPIIGIVGFAGAGKDTLGNILIDQFNFTKDSFAASLKDAVAGIFGWPRYLLEGDTHESRVWREQPDIWWENRINWAATYGKDLGKRFTPRIALQLFGTDLLRKSFHDDIWIASLEKRLLSSNRVVITDCRFPNEMKMIKNMGGSTLRVVRGPDPHWYELAKAANNYNSVISDQDQKIAHDLMQEIPVHSSEWALAGYHFDYVISNDSTIQDLENKVKLMVGNF